ncbi:hypothetical protein Ddc_16902 [Ditylenchus destructor]|nr:hypothetical protein Ddc_16902 [Ditylenchus destructor]
MRIIQLETILIVDIFLLFCNCVLAYDDDGNESENEPIFQPALMVGQIGMTIAQMRQIEKVQVFPSTTSKPLCSWYPGPRVSDCSEGKNACPKFHVTARTHTGLDIQTPPCSYDNITDLWTTCSSQHYYFPWNLIKCHLYSAECVTEVEVDPWFGASCNFDFFKTGYKSFCCTKNGIDRSWSGTWLEVPKDASIQMQIYYCRFVDKGPGDSCGKIMCTYSNVDLSKSNNSNWFETEIDKAKECRANQFPRSTMNGPADNSIEDASSPNKAP